MAHKFLSAGRVCVLVLVFIRKCSLGYAFIFCRGGGCLVPFSTLYDGDGILARQR